MWFRKKQRSKMTLIKKTDGSLSSTLYYTCNSITQKVIKVEIHYANELGLGHELAHAIRHRYRLYNIKATSLLQNFIEMYREEYNTWLLCETFIKPKYWNREKAQRHLDTYYSKGMDMKRLLIPIRFKTYRYEQ